MAKRTDSHLPTNINPSDYRYLLSFSYPGANGDPGVGMAMLTAMRTGEPQREAEYGVSEFGTLIVTGYHMVTSPWGKLTFARIAHGEGRIFGGCDICGTGHRHGDALLHTPTNTVVLIGHICADKMDLVTRRGEWTANIKRLAQLRKTAEYKAARAKMAGERAAAAATFIIEHNLTAALTTDHYIVRDIAARLAQWGNISEKQVALVMKLHKEATQPETVPAGETLVTPPTGRVTVEGVVLSEKEVMSDYGSVTKMLVKVQTAEGVYKVWGSVPSGMYSDLRGKMAEAGQPNVDARLRGCTVRFSAKVQPKENGFGFYSRPTKPALVSLSA